MLQTLKAERPTQ
eukprot:gene26987-biopygen17559